MSNLTTRLWIGIALALLIVISSAFAQDDFLDDGSGSSSHSVSGTSTGGNIVKVNPFLKVSNFAIRVVLFFLFVLPCWLGSLEYINRAVESEGDIYSRFFWANFLFSVVVIVFFFICFSDLFYQTNAATIGDHFRKIQWYIWILLFLLILVLIIFLRRKSSSNE